MKSTWGKEGMSGGSEGGIQGLKGLELFVIHDEVFGGQEGEGKCTYTPGGSESGIA